MDFSTLTGAVDGAAVVTAILAIGAILVLPKVAAWGVRTVKGLIR